MDEMYGQYAKIVYHFLYSKCHDAHLAEELTQETFLQAYRSMDRYDGSCKLSVWLCQIAKHLFFRHLRRRGREIPSELLAEGGGEGGGEDGRARTADTERQAMARIELLDVLKEMQHLPPQTREVMYLRVIGDLSFKEIGEILGRSENWARVSFFRGKEKLLEWKEGQDG